ncbi:MAG: DUF547 domain-containing protein [Pseudobacteriovorax sp.]|nr:DUF547 domain-containing protein [Pseudobacteriovorax sp.]
MKTIFALFVTFFLGMPGFSFDHSHSVWDKDLKKYLDKEGWVDYKSWKNDPANLKAYNKSLSSVTEVQYNSFSVAQKKAFLINAYNSFTVELILKHYPVKSIKKIGGIFSSPWKIEFFSLLGGKLKTLDTIEHEWLRKIPELKDYRVHAAVNCASVACPRLHEDAFVAEKLDQQMDQAMRTWINDPMRNKLGKKELELSKIFSWFGEDFGNEKEIVAIVKKYAKPEVAKTISPDADVDYLSYDWDLNKQNRNNS